MLNKQTQALAGRNTADKKHQGRMAQIVAPAESTPLRGCLAQIRSVSGAR